MDKTLKVGTDIKYFCNRCGLELGHRILAMIGSTPARVRCNTCFSERNFRAKKEVSKILKESAPRSLRSTKLASSSIYQQKISESLMKTPKTYRADQRFEVGDVVQHPVFGKGVVMKLIFPDRMDILFADQSKTLICAAQKEQA